MILVGTDHKGRKVTLDALSLPAYGAIINDGELVALLKLDEKLANQWLAVRVTAWKDQHDFQRGKGR